LSIDYSGSGKVIAFQQDCASSHLKIAHGYSQNIQKCILLKIM
jgi:uncharacterized protein YuzE